MEHIKYDGELCKEENITNFSCKGKDIDIDLDEFDVNDKTKITLTLLKNKEFREAVIENVSLNENDERISDVNICILNCTFDSIVIKDLIIKNKIKGTYNDTMTLSGVQAKNIRLENIYKEVIHKHSNKSSHSGVRYMVKNSAINNLDLNISNYDQSSVIAVDRSAIGNLCVHGVTQTLCIYLYRENTTINNIHIKLDNHLYDLRNHVFLDIPGIGFAEYITIDNLELDNVNELFTLDISRHIIIKRLTIKYNRVGNDKIGNRIMNHIEKYINSIGVMEVVGRKEQLERDFDSRFILTKEKDVDKIINRNKALIGNKTLFIKRYTDID